MQHPIPTSPSACTADKLSGHSEILSLFACATTTGGMASFPIWMNGAGDAGCGSSQQTTGQSNDLQVRAVRAIASSSGIIAQIRAAPSLVDTIHRPSGHESGY